MVQMIVRRLPTCARVAEQLVAGIDVVMCAITQQQGDILIELGQTVDDRESLAITLGSRAYQQGVPGFPPRLLHALIDEGSFHDLFLSWCHAVPREKRLEQAQHLLALRTEVPYAQPINAYPLSEVPSPERITSRRATGIRTRRDPRRFDRSDTGAVPTAGMPTRVRDGNP